MSVVKHFPGIGRTTLDSHLERPDLATDRDTLLSVDGAPFRAAIAEGVAAIMLAHIRYTALDPRWPASLSEKVVEDLLRKEMGYDGLVVTDDLDMGAIVRHYPDALLLERVVRAGVDIALVCHSGPRRDRALAHLKRAIEKNARTEEHKCSIARIIAHKKRFLGDLCPGGSLSHS